MAVQDWSTTPAANTSIDGINIAENCPPGGVNNALRAIMASVRVMFNNIPSVANFVTKTGGAFTGNPIFQGRGGYLHHADSSFTAGRVTIQPDGAALPSSASEGDIVLGYA